MLREIPVYLLLSTDAFLEILCWDVLGSHAS